jgi:hypothetical protein
MLEARLIGAVVFLILAIISLPLTVMMKYGKKNRKLTMVFGIAGAISTLVFIFLIWPYLPD